MMMTEEGFVLPVGFKFLPTEEQLLSYFLYKKVTRELSPVDTLFVKECDIYGDKDPWQIWDDKGGRQMEAQNSRDLYLFTQLKQMNEKNGSRKKRTVGGGTWSAVSTIEIYSESPSTKEKVLLGFKKRFSYESKTKKKKTERLMGNNNVGWIMFEFSLNPKMLSPSCPNDYVLCLLRKPPLSKKRKLLQYYLEEEVQDDDDDDDQGRAKRLEASHPSSSSGQQHEGNGEGVSSNCGDDLLVTCPLQQVTPGNIRVVQYDQTTSNCYNIPPPALITSDVGGGSTDVTNGIIPNSTSSSLITGDVGGGASTDVTNGIIPNSTSSSLITGDVGGASTDVTNGIIPNSTSSSLITGDVGGGASTAVTNGIIPNSTTSSLITRDVGGGSTAVINGISSDSTLASVLVEDFLDSLLQDFDSVDEAFPDLFGDS